MIPDSYLDSATLIVLQLLVPQAVQLATISGIPATLLGLVALSERTLTGQRLGCLILGYSLAWMAVTPYFGMPILDLALRLLLLCAFVTSVLAAQRRLPA